MKTETERPAKSETTRRWEEYELEKLRLKRLNLPAREYDEAIRRLVDRLEL